MDYQKELELALAAARKAGEIIVAGYQASYQADEKGIGDLVCDVDRDADKVISDMISSSFPHDAILSEELSPEIDSREGRLWIVDPLYGTAGFLFHAGKGIPAVLVAFQVDGVTQVGVVYIPLTGEMFHAVKGGGAFKNDNVIKTGGETSLSKSWIELNHYGDASYETEGFKKLRDALRSPGGASIVTVGMPHSASAMRVIESDTDVAAVVHDNNPAKVKQAGWDVAAPKLVIEEAGGGFWGMDGQDYDPFKVIPFVVAGSKELAEQIISLWNE